MPTIHLYVNACSKLSKMFDNSSCLPKQLAYWKYLEQLKITGELYMCSFMSSWNTKFRIHTFNVQFRVIFQNQVIYVNYNDIVWYYV